MAASDVGVTQLYIALGRGEVVIVAKSARSNSLALWDMAADLHPMDSVYQDASSAATARDIGRTIFPRQMRGLEAPRVATQMRSITVALWCLSSEDL